MTLDPRLSGLVVQIKLFSKTLDGDHQVAIRFPGWDDTLFFPANASDVAGTDGSMMWIEGVLEDGYVARVILTADSFPVCLVSVPRADKHPAREFGFA